MQLSKHYLFNLITTFLSQASSAGLIIFLLPILQVKLSILEFSNYGVLLNMILMFSTLDFGLNIGLMRRLIHEAELASALISSTFYFFLLLLTVLFPTALLIFSNGYLNSNGIVSLTSLLVAILAIQTIMATLFETVLQSSHKIYIAKLIRIGKTVLEFIVLYFISERGSVNFILLGSLLVNTLFIIFLFVYSKKYLSYSISFANVKWNLLVNHLRYSFWYFLNSIGIVLVFNSQVVLLNAVSSHQEVTSYFLVTKFLDIVRLGATNFAIILFPSIAQYEANGNWILLKQTYFRMLASITLFSSFILIFLITIGQRVFQYWSGRSDDNILHLFSVLSVFTILIVIDNVSSVFLHALRLNKMQTIISLVQGTIALLLGFILLKEFGVIGFAFASITALLLTNFFYNPAFLINRLKQKTLQSL